MLKVNNMVLLFISILLISFITFIIGWSIGFIRIVTSLLCLCFLFFCYKYNYVQYKNNWFLYLLITILLLVYVSVNYFFLRIINFFHLKLLDKLLGGVICLAVLFVFIIKILLFFNINIVHFFIKKILKGKNI